MLKNNETVFILLKNTLRNIRSKIRHYLIKLEYAQYKGSGLTCNACRVSYKQFAPHYPHGANKAALEENQVIAGYGENVFCPNCMTRSRDRLIIGMLEQIDLANKKVLHLSPEKQIFQHIQKKTSVVTADLFPSKYRHIDAAVMCADITRLPFDDQSFDLVVANHILEHIPDDKKAMKELFRVLKKNSQAILQVPYSVSIAKTLEDPLIDDPDLQSKLFGQKDHVRIYQLDEYLRRLKDVGFDVEISSYESMSSLYKYGIQPGESFFVLKKIGIN